MLGQKHAARLSLIYLDIIGAAKVRLFFYFTKLFSFRHCKLVKNSKSIAASEPKL